MWNSFKDDIWVRWYLAKRMIRNNILLFFLAILVMIAIFLMSISILELMLSIKPSILNFLF